MMPRRSAPAAASTTAYSSELSFRKNSVTLTVLVTKHGLKTRTVKLNGKTHIMLNAMLVNFHLKNTDFHYSQVWIAVPNESHYLHALKLVFNDEIPFNGLHIKGHIQTMKVPGVDFNNQKDAGINEDQAPENKLITSHVIVVNEVSPQCVIIPNAKYSFMESALNDNANSFAYFISNEITGFAQKETISIDEKVTIVQGRLAFDNDSTLIGLEFRDKRAQAIQKEGCESFFFNGSLRVDFKRSKRNASWLTVSIKNFESGSKVQLQDETKIPTSSLQKSSSYQELTFLHNEFPEDY